MSTCPHRPACDGCPLFELSDDEAATRKLERIERSFDSYDVLRELTPTSIEQGNTLAYRNRARMAVSNEELGFYTEGSRQLLPISNCAVHVEPIEHVLEAVRRGFPGDFLGSGVKRIDARWGDGHGVLTFVLEDLDAWMIRRTTEFAAQLSNWGVSVTTVAETGGVLSNEIEVLSEPAAATMKVGGMRFEAPSAAFFQVNVEMLERIHACMRAAMGDEEVLVDAYCGVGTHGIALAQGREVFGFDVAESAIESARANAEKNQVVGRFDVLGADEAAKWQWPTRPHITIANPARAGMTHRFIRTLGDSMTSTLLYLSCEPQTLARDVERLRAVGFHPERAWAFDLMPRTEHVETLVLLRRGEPIELPYESAYRAGKYWPMGVTGPRTESNHATSSVWFARVNGKAPHGQPPARAQHSQMDVRRLRNIGDQSVVQIRLASANVRELRQRMRAWGYPIVGDSEFGVASLNGLMARKEWVDRPLLHCVRVTTAEGVFDAPVPAELLPYFRLPSSYFELPAPEES